MSWVVGVHAVFLPHTHRLRLSEVGLVGEVGVAHFFTFLLRATCAGSGECGLLKERWRVGRDRGIPLLDAPLQV
jgi:hypothetical protein